MLTLNELQSAHAIWHARNFPKLTGDQCLIGALEELGELAHAHLKQQQHLRPDEAHSTNAKDPIGDVIIFLTGYCAARGFNLQEILETTWGKVKQRDYTKEQA